MSGKKYVLDSYAVLALLENEPGSRKVSEIITGEAETSLSVISLGEIYYIISRKLGSKTAEKIVHSILLDESVKIAEAPWARVKAAASIKANGGLSYADAFVLGLASELQSAVVTGDPEIRAAAAGLNVEVVWLGA